MYKSLERIFQVLRPATSRLQPYTTTCDICAITLYIKYSISASTLQALFYKFLRYFGGIMPSKKPQFVIRTDKDTINKISYIAKENERNATQEIVYLIKQHIKDYESKHGILTLEEDGSMKPKKEKSSNSKTG
jgi:hypothetical protein